MCQWVNFVLHQDSKFVNCWTSFLWKFPCFLSQLCQNLHSKVADGEMFCSCSLGGGEKKTGSLSPEWSKMPAKSKVCCLRFACSVVASVENPPQKKNIQIQVKTTFWGRNPWFHMEKSVDSMEKSVDSMEKSSPIPSISGQIPCWMRVMHWNSHGAGECLPRPIVINGVISPLFQEISNRTHFSRTPKPEYLIARSQLT